MNFGTGSTEEEKSKTKSQNIPHSKARWEETGQTGSQRADEVKGNGKQGQTRKSFQGENGPGQAPWRFKQDEG